MDATKSPVFAMDVTALFKENTVTYHALRHVRLAINSLENVQAAMLAGTELIVTYRVQLIVRAVGNMTVHVCLVKMAGMEIYVTDVAFQDQVVLETIALCQLAIVLIVRMDGTDQNAGNNARSVSVHVQKILEYVLTVFQDFGDQIVQRTV
jgi:hypothetical protein